MRGFLNVFLAIVVLVKGQPLERVSLTDVASPKPFHRAAARTPQHHRRGHASIQRRQSQSQYGAIGLGDNADLFVLLIVLRVCLLIFFRTYTVALQIGGEATVLNLGAPRVFLHVALKKLLSIACNVFSTDTGSSDLWVITTSCNSSTCQSAKATPYSPSSFQPIQSNANMKLVYGDSTTGTYASGLVGTDNVQLAGIGLEGQIFLAVNDTNNVSVENGAAGVLGLGFPTERCASFTGSPLRPFLNSQSISALSSIKRSRLYVSRVFRT